MAVALRAFDAVVHVHGPDGPRAVALADLHRLPGDAPERDTTLEHGELITAVDLPRAADRGALGLPQGPRPRLVRVRARVGRGAPSSSTATRSPTRASRSAASPTRRGARAAAEQALRGAPATEASFRAAADAELRDARPLEHNAFKVPMATNALVATLRDLTGAARPSAR